MHIFNTWHMWLGMPPFDRAWHERDMADELAEYREETSFMGRWSELSDLVYTYTRAQWCGHSVAFPLKRWQYYIGLPYMFWKYTSRFLFYRSAGHAAGAAGTIRYLGNPKKLYKLEAAVIAQNITVDHIKLLATCEKQRRYWPLLP